MNTAAIQTRPERDTPETLVIAKTDEGYRVFSPLTPANQFVVRDTGDDIICTCPEFTNHRDDPEGRCKHIEAVLAKFPGTSRNGVAAQSPAKSNGQAPRQKPTGAQMLLKRSVSTDGKIDSLSVEFSCEVGKSTSDELKSRADQMLKLQTAIVTGFLATGGKSNGHANGKAQTAPMLGTIANVGGMDTRRGRRLFLNLSANGNTFKLFGTERELADALALAGYPNRIGDVREGQEFNLACRIVTKPSQDGRYVNIDRIFPVNG